MLSASTTPARAVPHSTSPLMTVMHILDQRDQPDYEHFVLEHAAAFREVVRRLDALQARFPKFRVADLGPYVKEALLILERNGISVVAEARSVIA